MSETRRAKGPSTLAVHGAATHPSVGPLEPPIVTSSAFGFESSDVAAAAFRGESEAYVYGRWGNPTVEHLESKLAALEHAERAVATASGMAAVSGAVLAHARAGDHVVAPRSMYGEAARLFRERLPRLGIETTFVDELDAAGFAAAVRPTTRIVYVETPANPMLAITDVAAVAAMARDRGLVTIADNTFATPYCQNPLDLGADVVVHSMTKAIGGHGDAIGGAAAGSLAAVAAIADVVVKGFGGVISPFNAYLVARGASTLALRQARACASAATLARWLEAHPAVARVHHPSLPSHPGHAIATRQMRAFGSILSFEAAGGFAAARALVDRVRVATHAVSLGDVRTLVVHPASTTASTMPEADRRRAGIADALVRLSVGIEDVDDLVEDLDQALSAASRGA